MAGGMGTTTSNLETVGSGAPSTTASLPVASGVTVNSPPVSRPTQVAYLTLPDTTVTAIAVPGTTGLAVLQGSGETLTFRAEGVTLSDGNVVSLGFDGLVESTTTAMYEPLTGVSAESSFASSSGGGAGDLTPSYSLPTGPGPVLINSTFPFLTATTSSTSGDTELTGEQTSAGTLITTASSESANAATTSGGTGGGSAGGSESGASATQGSASPSASQDAAATLSAGRAAMLLGAVGGLAAWGL